LPMKTMVDAELHDGGSTSFTLVVLLVTSNACSRRHGPCVAVFFRVRMFGWLAGRRLDSCSQYLPGRI
jgi:hypothetical protein